MSQKGRSDGNQKGQKVSISLSFQRSSKNEKNFRNVLKIFLLKAQSFKIRDILFSSSTYKSFQEFKKFLPIIIVEASLLVTL